MSWLRLQEASDCIPHPYWMYAKCFGTLIWCERSYGSTPSQNPVVPTSMGADRMRSELDNLSTYY